jgi:hypothetical protein
MMPCASNEQIETLLSWVGLLKAEKQREEEETQIELRKVKQL